MAAIIKIGNSQGVRIPKPILQQAKLEGTEIEFKVTSEGLLLMPVNTNPRQGWSEQLEMYDASQDEAFDQEWLDADLNEGH